MKPPADKIRQSGIESTLNCEDTNSLSMDIGNFPQGVSKFTEPFSIVFDKFVTEPEVRMSIKTDVCMFRQMLFFRHNFQRVNTISFNGINA